MKNNLRKTLVSLLVIMTLVITTIPSYVLAAGSYSITVNNKLDNGISIEGDTFGAYQIFVADALTTYAVHESFKSFFDDVKTGDDGNTYDFNAALDAITNATDPHEIAIATQDYNQLAGKYIESYQNNLYDLAVAIRAHISDATNGILPITTGVATLGEEKESVTLSGLTGGYYFVFDQASTLPGLGVAHSGAFVPVGRDVAEHPTIEVKSNVPTVDKKIWHNDLDGAIKLPDDKTENGQWDITGDYQIGDTARFLVTSKLPSNIEDYNFDNDDTVDSMADYFYTLTDTMSNGLSYNGDVKVYIDHNLTTALPEAYYTATTKGNGFLIQVNVKSLLNDPAYTDLTQIYTYYTGLVTSDAKISNEYEENTIRLDFSNNPNDDTHKGSDEKTVYSYTFDLAINKMDENGDGLVGATFGIYKGSNLLPVSFLKEVDGVDYYYVDPAKVVTDEDPGYIVTKDNNDVKGKFVINGLDDDVEYTLKEVAAPSGYNAIDPISFIITAEYNSTTGKIITLTNNNPLISSSGEQSGFEAEIINRKKVYLPATGGVGTVIFQVGGGLLMLSAIAYLFIFNKKKAK